MERVTAALSTPGLRYRSFGNEPVRTRPAPPMEAATPPEPPSAEPASAEPPSTEPEAWPIEAPPSPQFEAALAPDMPPPPEPAPVPEAILSPAEDLTPMSVTSQDEAPAPRPEVGSPAAMEPAPSIDWMALSVAAAQQPLPPLLLLPDPPAAF
ncbi:MAG TPA: hypothetical protein VEY31_11065, partial [Roseococcus sp.]|nr:hypothetical protein [Roseococcus sp.]